MVGLERLLIGRTLDGRYTVEELIGQGRGGLVYRARHAQTGVEVALKVLSAPRTPEARERFRGMVAGEVRAAAAIEHPNTAGVYCLAHDPELDLDFVASELLRGQTLASVLSQRGKPPIALGLRLLADAAEGLAAGHRAGLVHRDLRPASLYLVRGEGERQVRVKVAGFGVPQIVRRESLAGAAPEVSAYASPEMLAAGSLRLTPASDVFGLGVVGYELLTGKLPFDEAARRALAEGRAVEAEPPVDVASTVPPQVVDAVLQALRCDPGARFADGAAFSAALQQQVRQVMVLGKITPAAQHAVPPAEPAPEPSAEPASDERASAAAAPAIAAAAAGALVADSTGHAAAVEIADLAVDDHEPGVAELAAAQPVASTADAVAPRAAPAAAFDAPSADPTPAAVPVATLESAPVAPHVPVAPPLADLTRAPVPQIPPKRVGPAAPDLELYYPPQAPKPPVITPIAASVTPPVQPQPVAAPVETPALATAESISIAEAPAAPVLAAAALPSAPLPVVPKPAVVETPAFAPVAAAAPTPTPMPGAARRRGAAAGKGGFKGSAMAAGFVLGLLVLGSAAWVATRHGAKPADSATVPLANQLAQGPAVPSATPAQPLANAQESAPAPAADTASRTPAQRAADARKKQQDDERRRQDEEKLRQAQLPLQQQLAQQAPAAAAQPAPQQPAPAQPQPQQVATVQPQRPAPQTAAPPPAAVPARVEPAARAPSANEVFDEDVVEQRPRLTNVNELQRALQDRYPAQLQANRVSGSVMASFVVGADGRVDPGSIQIVNSPNPGFNAPTQSVLRRARFRPATVKGQPVRVQVTMPISWTLAQ
jgi:TonB family protein